MCCHTPVLPFRVQFRPGVSLYAQVVYAAKKAIISRQLRPGDLFPSVRTISKELKVNPNTAHKVVSHLVATGLLDTLPGIGTVVAVLPEASSAERTKLLENEIEELVVEAKKLRIDLDDVQSSISKHWKRLSGTRDRSTSELDREGGKR